MNPPLSPTFLDRLRELLGDRLSTSEAVCLQHGRDESIFEAMPPQAVAWPTSTEEVVALVKLCREHGVPITPYGAGSSLEGHTLAVRGGLTLNLQRMERILALNPEDLTATLQPGVTRKALNAALRDQGLFFPIDPGADATIGGMCATRASGTNAVRYGTMRENVVNLRVVTPDGEVVDTARRARKSAAGYDLTRLFVGSEGTLGVIVEATVRLHPLPEHVMAAVCAFPEVHGAIDTVVQVIQMGVPVARCEFVDAVAIRAINAFSQLALPESPHLFFEFHGSQAGVKEQVEVVEAIVADHGGQDFQWAATPEARSRLWEARHNVYFAALQLRPGCRSIVTDACVPISRLADCLVQTADDLRESGLIAPMVGHVGDGNFHVQMLVDDAAPHELRAAEALNERLVRRALSMDGTCTGEHGIGLHKQGFLVEEVGAAGVDLMRRIKHALDPAGLMNPGKVFAPHA
ncbi:MULTISPECIES: FAD-binding oxidoreductase [Hydrogenophaga]|uniref:D-lactate dehydrogenase (cytochrome) n=1 Tax=Hydrogenophaga intermedia TaxID=65786 RepID=A0A1L1PE69_HYDIT|nr:MULTISPECIES: FAD-linked oxidase C-terminal domain-containing protein [Hydrogenophaga]AOS77699.1 2-hydroxy-acid oxidase [Hydrogenophaga sp. PBC]TMU75850.1 FAD-binding protein [Hydrogenophaga intermedia]CDN86363.1 FAD linked oxidase-like protein [Hydrogenophaga intermedia]